MRVVLALAAMVIAGAAAFVTCPSIARAQSGAGSIRLEWTAPGDDGTVGTATAYDIRYFVLPILESTFSLAARVTSLPAPAPAGTRQSVTVSGLTPGARYYFAIKSRDDQGNWSPMSNVASKTVGYALDAPEPAGVPLSFSSPRPNPARGSATFDFGLPESRTVSLEVFDIGGRRVRTLALGTRDAGRHSVSWDLTDDGGRSMGAGVYLVRAMLGHERFDRRVTVVR